MILKYQQKRIEFLPLEEEFCRQGPASPIASCGRLKDMATFPGSCRNTRNPWMFSYVARETL